MIKTLESESSLQSLIVSNKLTAIEFYANWCGPCRVITPKFEEFSRKYTNVNFAKVDMDNYEAVANAYKIKTLPTFIFFKNGQQIYDFKVGTPKHLETSIKRFQ